MPLTIGCSYRHFIASLISGVDRLEVINSAVNKALLRAAGKQSKVWMNAYEPAAYHHSVRLLYQITNHRLNYNIINTETQAFGQ